MSMCNAVGDNYLWYDYYSFKLFEREIARYITSCGEFFLELDQERLIHFVKGDVTLRRRTSCSSTPQTVLNVKLNLCNFVELVSIQCAHLESQKHSTCPTPHQDTNITTNRKKKGQNYGTQNNNILSVIQDKFTCSCVFYDICHENVENMHIPNCFNYLFNIWFVKMLIYFPVLLNHWFCCCHNKIMSI